MNAKQAVITGDLLKAQASKLWGRLPQYASKEEPKWSNGWLRGFKTQFKIKEYVTYGEGGAAAIKQPDAIKQMDSVRSLCT
jgi:hypothetical protein